MNLCETVWGLLLQRIITHVLSYVASSSHRPRLQEGQSLAGGLVSRGEWGLESLKSMPRDGAVGRVLEQLADPALEARIMRGIENLDTGRVSAGWCRANIANGF